MKNTVIKAKVNFSEDQDREYMDINTIKLSIQHGQIPSDFSDWHVIVNDRMETAAHYAAIYGGLPNDFNQWHLADDGGKTVAHLYVEYRALPTNFNQWDLANNVGTTVAHTAAVYGHLPTDFVHWDLTNNQGVSVYDVAKEHGNLPSTLKRYWMYIDEAQGPDNICYAVIDKDMNILYIGTTKDEVWAGAEVERSMNISDLMNSGYRMIKGKFVTEEIEER